MVSLFALTCKLGAGGLHGVEAVPRGAADALDVAEGGAHPLHALPHSPYCALDSPEQHELLCCSGARPLPCFLFLLVLLSALMLIELLLLLWLMWLGRRLGLRLGLRLPENPSPRRGSRKRLRGAAGRSEGRALRLLDLAAREVLEDLGRAPLQREEKEVQRMS